VTIAIESTVQQGMAQAIRLGYRIELPQWRSRSGTISLLTLAGEQVEQRDDVTPEDFAAAITGLVQNLGPSGDLTRGRWGKKPHYSDPKQCRYCGAGGPDSDHRRTVCRACDMPQCLYPHGACPLCYVGYLDGVSYGSYLDGSKRCGYKCTGEAVAKAPRVRRVCKDHLGRPTSLIGGRKVTVAEQITSRVAMLGQTSGVPDWQRTYWFPEGAR
jgi:hypothetical protein